jgi:coenzyme F420-reducing hydrogenase beta subunit
MDAILCEKCGTIAFFDPYFSKYICDNTKCMHAQKHTKTGKEKSMKVIIWLITTSQPIEHDNVKNTYTKGGLFCVYCSNGSVVKYPLCNVFRVEEPYMA